MLPREGKAFKIAPPVPRGLSSIEKEIFDSGNFLFRTNPEKVIYYPDEIDVRAGWDLVQEFILK